MACAVQNNTIQFVWIQANPTIFATMFSFHRDSFWDALHGCAFALAVILALSVAPEAQSQSFQVNWPGDVLEGSCDESIDVVSGNPEVSSDNGCDEVVLTFEEEVLEPTCEQETWVDRQWMAVGCGDTLKHLQRIRLRDEIAPVVVFDEAYSGHFCSETLDWLPNVQDNCDVSLSGDFSTSDTTDLCGGVYSFVVALDVSDDCGNVLDTTYTVFLHEACDAIEYPVVAGCADSTATNFEMNATCDDGTCIYANELCGEGTYFDLPSGVCLPLSNCANPWEYCGPLTVWDVELERCVPEVISAACYFDINGSGTVDIADLLGFLGVYGASCIDEE